MKKTIINSIERNDLTIKHCKSVLDRELIIGSSKARDGKQKRFVMNVWMNEYIVTHGGTIVDSGQAIEELLNVYNEL